MFSNKSEPRLLQQEGPDTTTTLEGKVPHNSEEIKQYTVEEIANE